MNHIYKTFLALGSLVILTLISCEKSNPIAFKSKPALVFGQRVVSENKITYSFLGNPLDQGEVRIPIRIVGFPEDRDRSYELEVVMDTITNAKPELYTIPQGLLKAGVVVDTLSIKVRKTEDLNESVADLYLRVKANEEFDRGVIERQYFKVSWSNQAIMPTWGVYFRTFISAAGSTKAFRIFVETTGLQNFTAADFRVYGQLGAEVLGKKFGDYIREWNAANPTDILVHDDGLQEGQPIVPRY
ncbi:DUF4843 domain-containing protein [Sphingobacterium sp. UT-1RO-CII-1]|uniref:DUF4843 domain-containing protein n=1 Tax=Sphingobacterium sp. UT-1RO-CII-1 TaxID=2995225 RepID=UPI00227C08AC|nr:DUF4843 domain-containing protein [Sphingobacterium sp. UT-1RO-CII-1]MCY4780734.1 DUF4843 domain-containing protein [Sphingobacterium sp. UT-1RO-CII-1]